MYLLDDGQHYNTWLDELKDKYPFFQTQKLEASSAGCMLTGHPNVTFIKAKLTKIGGFYFSEHTMIAHFSQNLKNLSFIDRYDVDNKRGFLYELSWVSGTINCWWNYGKINFMIPKLHNVLISLLMWKPNASHFEWIHQTKYSRMIFGNSTMTLGCWHARYFMAHRKYLDLYRTSMNSPLTSPMLFRSVEVQWIICFISVFWVCYTLCKWTHFISMETVHQVGNIGTP